MVMVTAGSKETEEIIENPDLENIDRQLITMWKNYISNHIYENPVELSKFFAQFSALFGYYYVIVNKYKLQVDVEVAHKTKALMIEYATASATERDGFIRRTERSTRSRSEYYLAQVSWAKLCINEMQTLLRLAGDEAKMTGNYNV